jgi:hypothetical protein
LITAIILLILRILLSCALLIFTGLLFRSSWKELKKNSLKREELPEIRFDVALPNGELFSSEQTEVYVGRSTECDIHLSDEAISEKHACFFFHESQWWIKDLNSHNGTYINGKAIESPVVVIAGDEIKIAEIRLLVMKQNSENSYSFLEESHE